MTSKVTHKDRVASLLLLEDDRRKLVALIRERSQQLCDLQSEADLSEPVKAVVAKSLCRDIIDFSTQVEAIACLALLYRNEV